MRLMRSLPRGEGGRLSPLVSRSGNYLKLLSFPPGERLFYGESAPPRGGSQVGLFFQDYEKPGGGYPGEEVKGTRA